MARTTKPRRDPPPEAAAATPSAEGMELGFAVFLGSLVAVVVVVTASLMSQLHPIADRRIDPWAPLLVLLGLLVVTGLTRLLVAYRGTLFKWRFEIIIVALLLAGVTNGINLGPFDPTDLVLSAVLLFWLFVALVEQQPLRVPAIVLALALLLIACSVLSIVNGGTGSLIAQRSLVNKCALLVVLASIVSTETRWRFALRAFLVMAAVSGVIALITGIVHLLTGVGLSAGAMSGFRYKATPFGYLLRVTALTTTTQTLAHVLLLGVSLALIVPLRRVVRILCVAVMGAAIVWTFSVGGIAVFVFILALSFPLRRPERSLHYVLALMAGLAVAYLSGAITFFSESFLVPLGGKGAEDRIVYLQAGLEAIQRHPWVGIGLGNIGRVLSSPVHNAYIQVTAETGLPGGAVFTTLIVYLVLASWAAFRSLSAGEERTFLKASFLGMVALATHLLVEPFFPNYMTWAYMGIVAGILAYQERRRRAVPLGAASGAPGDQPA